MVLAKLEEQLVAAEKADQAAAMTTAAKYWLSLYNTGKAIFPALSLVPALGHAYAFWFGQQRDNLIGAAIGFTVGIVPYTILLMGRVNARIAGFTSAENDGNNKDELIALMKQWVVLNFARALLPLIASVLGLVAAYHHV